MSVHADLATLLGYWLGELGEAKEAELETHYLGCDECAARLSEIELVASGHPADVRRGAPGRRGARRPSPIECASAGCASASTLFRKTAA
jgi:hypothetical protein